MPVTDRVSIHPSLSFPPFSGRARCLSRKMGENKLLCPSVNETCVHVVARRTAPVPSVLKAPQHILCDRLSNAPDQQQTYMWGASAPFGRFRRTPAFQMRTSIANRDACLWVHRFANPSCLNCHPHLAASGPLPDQSKNRETSHASSKPSKDSSTVPCGHGFRRGRLVLLRLGFAQP